MLADNTVRKCVKQVWVLPPNLRTANCSQVNVERELNSGAVFLDIIPGILLGIIPIFVDAVTNNLYRMPEAYSYSCAG